MEKLRNTILIASLVLVGLTIPVRAEMATMDEALTVANNWINLIIQKTGSWGDANTAYVEEIQEFKRGRRTLGYFCRVKPMGYMVLSLHKQLAPVKAYSATSDLDPESEVGMAELLKDCMERIHNWINEWGTRMNASPDEVMAEILEINYRDSWDRLNIDALSFQQNLDSEVEPMNYQGGEPWLLTSSWHQGDPYNLDCPPPPTGDDCTAARCSVGCVATAGAQIMRYWNWPPHGVGTPYNDYYDWLNMPDSADSGSSTAEKNAVAELCSEVGIAVNMNYCGPPGCQSGVPTRDMEGVYENQYRYSTACALQNRTGYTAANWFSFIQGELNANRPLHYRIIGHSIVCDGWRIVGTDKEYHMNYGWNNNRTAWYTLDGLFYLDPNGTTDDEYVLENIKPAPSLGSTLMFGIYGRLPYPYRYFDQDCASIISSTFAAGQNLQFLPGVKLRCVSPSPGDRIRFGGTIAENIRLYSIKGAQSAGIKIYNGAIELYAGGGLTFY